ncbi:cadherin EGF LAG seven-pass G-type receptor 1, partial [Brachionus plicatilis]
EEMCYRAECERVQNIQVMEHTGTHRIQVMGGLDRAVAKMRHNCPGGTSQESFVHKKKFREAGLVFTKSCNEYLNEKFAHMNKAEKEALSAVCCEEFIKFSSFKCDGKEGNCDGNICEEKPCHNNGKCVEVKLKGRDKFTFECVCAKGFSGPLCLTVDPCYFNPCGFNEMCRTFGTDGYYVCMCVADKKNHSKCEDNFVYGRGKFFFGSKDKIRKNLSLVVTSALSVFISSFIVLQSISVFTANVKRVPV